MRQPGGSTAAVKRCEDGVPTGRKLRSRDDVVWYPVQNLPFAIFFARSFVLVNSNLAPNPTSLVSPLAFALRSVHLCLASDSFLSCASLFAWISSGDRVFGSNDLAFTPPAGLPMTEEDVPPASPPASPPQVALELTPPVDIPPQPAELEPQATLDVPPNDM